MYKIELKVQDSSAELNVSSMPQLNGRRYRKNIEMRSDVRQGLHIKRVATVYHPSSL